MIPFLAIKKELPLENVLFIQKVSKLKSGFYPYFLNWTVIFEMYSNTSSHGKMNVQHFFYLGYMCVFLKEIREAYVNSMILSWLLRQLILGILMPFTYFIDNEEDFFSLLDKEQDTKKKKLDPQWS